MPFFEDKGGYLTPIPDNDPRVDTSSSRKPAFTDILGATWERYSEIGSARADATFGQEYEPDWDYKPWDDPVNKGYEGYTDRAVNADEAADIRSNVDRERENALIREQAPFWEDFAAQVLVASASPINVASIFFPVFHGAKAASFLKGAAIAGAEGAVAEAGIQAALQGTQETITLTESAVDLMAATMLVGVVGGGAGAVTGHYQKKYREAVKQNEAALKEILEERQAAYASQPQSGGAAAVAPGTTEAYVPGTKVGPVAGGAAAQAAMATVKWHTPVNTLFSPADGVRTATANLAEHSVRLEGTDPVVGVETLAKQHRQTAEAITLPMKEAATEYVKRTGEKITDLEFAERVWWASIQTEKTGHPEIDRIAEMYQKRVYEPLTKDLIDHGLLTNYSTEFKEAQALWDRHSDVMGQPSLSEMADDIDRMLVSGERTGVDEIDAFLDDMIEENVTFRSLDLIGGEQYLNRLYDVAVINRDPAGFKAMLTEEFSTSFEKRARAMDARQADFHERYKQTEEQLASVRRKSNRQISEISEDIARLEAEQQRLLKAEPGKGGTKDFIQKQTRKLEKSKQALLKELDTSQLEMKLRSQANRLKASRDRAIAARQEVEAQLDDIEDIVQQTYAHITGKGRGKLPPGLEMGKTGSLQARTLDIQDTKLAPWLSRDMEKVGTRFAETVGADLELHRRFGTTKASEIIEQTGAMRDWDEIIESAPQAERRKLNVQAQRDYADIEAIVERIKGLRGWAEDASSTLVRSGQMLRATTFMSKLGRMTLTALTDLARPGMVHGYGDTMKMAAKMLTDMDLRKVSTETLRRWGAVTELASNARIMNLAETMQQPGYQTSFEKFMSAATNVFAKATGMTHMNEGMKLFTGTLFMDIAARAIMKGDFAHRSLTGYGINEAMAQRMQAQLKQHSTSHKGATLPGVEHWDDERAAQYFMGAALKAVDEAIITPGVLDRPKWMDAETGKLFGQFRSFGFAANNKTLIAGLSGSHASFHSGIAQSIGLGLMAYATKGTLAGRGEEVHNTLTGGDPFKLYNELVANAGFGMLFEYQQIMQRMAGFGTADRYAVRNSLGALMGPNLGTLQDMLKAAHSASNGEISEAEIRTMIRLIPFNNLWYLGDLNARAAQVVREAF